MSPIAEVQGRIAEIQAAMQVVCAQTATSVVTAPRTSSSAVSFADALAASTKATETDTVTPATAGGTVTGQALVDAAKAYVGAPYVWGAEDPAVGFDCSGLVQRAMSDVGVDVPRVARDQAKLGTAVASLADAKAGDLVVFGGGSHIGIYVGSGQMIDAPKPGKNVVVRDVYETPTAIRRVLPEASATTAQGGTAALSTAADLQRYALSMMSEGKAA